MRKPRGFTLIEMMIVVGVLIVLAGILLPAILRARERGRVVHCQNNLRQCGISMQFYGDQYAGYFPVLYHGNYDTPLGTTGIDWWEAILGHGNMLETTREIGIGFRTNLQSSQAWTHYTTLEVARTTTDRPFITGVVYNDDGDGICRSGEGVAGATVTLSHPSGFTLTTQTKTAGGYAFEVFVDDTFTLTINGQSTQVTVAGDNQKVDLRDGQIVQ